MNNNLFFKIIKFIYKMVISAIATIYGTVILTQFAYKTKAYKDFVDRMEEIEEQNPEETANYEKSASFKKFTVALGYDCIKNKS